MNKNIEENSRFGEIVITHRNENNSVFKIIPKKDFEIELGLIEKHKDDTLEKTIEYYNFAGIKLEIVIILMIKEGFRFFTYNNLDKTYTDVVVVDGHIKSLQNRTSVDNINNLPLIN